MNALCQTLRKLLLALGFLLALPTLQVCAQQSELQKSFDKFPLLASKVDDRGNAQFMDLEMDKNTVTIDDVRYGGFRFKAEGAADENFVWVFKMPKNVSSWFIVPSEGSMKGFQIFYNLHEKGIFQPLDAASLTPGKTYLIWFRIKDDQPAKVSLAFRFAKLKPDPKVKFTLEEIQNGLTPDPQSTPDPK